MDAINPILASEIQRLAKFYSNSSEYTTQLYQDVAYITLANKTTILLNRTNNTAVVLLHHQAGVFTYDWIDNKFIKRAIQQL